MLPWDAVATWGGRLAVLTGLATPIYGGLAYLQLTPVTQSYVTSQIADVRKDIRIGRADTLETRITVLKLARNDLIRERQATDGALKTESNPMSKATWARRIENIASELERIERTIAKLEDSVEEIRTQ